MIEKRESHRRNGNGQAVTVEPSLAIKRELLRLLEKVGRQMERMHWLLHQRGARR